MTEWPIRRHGWVGMRPAERMTGEVKVRDGVALWWVAELVSMRPVGARGGEVQLARYEVSMRYLYSWDREGDAVGFERTGVRTQEWDVFTLLHRPEEGSLVLGAKVLAKAFTQPEFGAYEWRVSKGKAD